MNGTVDDIEKKYLSQFSFFYGTYVPKGFIMWTKKNWIENRDAGNELLKEEYRTAIYYIISIKPQAL